MFSFILALLDFVTAWQTGVSDIATGIQTIASMSVR